MHYTTSCNTQSSVPEGGRDHRPKHVELIGIINKPSFVASSWCRAEFLGSNPHSNGDLFSRSSLIFLEISVANIIMAVDNRMVTAVAVVIIIITHLVLFTVLQVGKFRSRSCCNAI